MKGLDLRMKREERTQPWQGAAGVFHPVLTEAVVRFQAQAMGEIFPASGPVRTKIMGKKDQEKNEQAEREIEMNYLTEEMTEYRDETEHMLFRLPLAGSAFKKAYDPLMERPCDVRSCGGLRRFVWRVGPDDMPALHPCDEEDAKRDHRASGEWFLC